MMWDQLDMRQGDRLPIFTAELLYDDGTPIPLDGASDRATLALVGSRGHKFFADCLIVSGVQSTVLYDWQAGDTAGLPVDSYDVSVDVWQAATQQRMVVPNRRSAAILVIRPFAPAGDVPPPDTEAVYWDDMTDPQWDDPSDALRWRT